MTKTYRHGKMRPIMYGTFVDDVEILRAKDAAMVFAGRIARKTFGKKGYCHHVREDLRREDGLWFSFEAFVGYDLPRAYGGGTQGHNEWIEVTVK
jgi:hypothetical protein